MCSQPKQIIKKEITVTAPEVILMHLRGSVYECGRFDYDNLTFSGTTFAEFDAMPLEEKFEGLCDMIGEIVEPDQWDQTVYDYVRMFCKPEHYKVEKVEDEIWTEDEEGNEYNFVAMVDEISFTQEGMQCIVDKFYSKATNYTSTIIREQWVY